MSIKFYKISIFLPEDILEEMMNTISETIQPISTNYDFVFSYSKVVSTWRPLKGAHPYKGQINKIEFNKEIKLEFAIKKDDLDLVISKIKEIHPYEEPAIDIIPLILL